MMLQSPWMRRDPHSKSQLNLLYLRWFLLSHAGARGCPTKTVTMEIYGERIAWCGATGAVSTVESQPCTTSPVIS
jgi:hypothetical protein